MSFPTRVDRRDGAFYRAVSFAAEQLLKGHVPNLGVGPMPLAIRQGFLLRQISRAADYGEPSGSGPAK